MRDRRQQALQVRIDAAELASQREHPEQVNNGEEFRYRASNNTSTHIANFTKGLPHDHKGMLVVESETPGTFVRDNDYYLEFVKAIDSGDERDFRDIPLGPPGSEGTPRPTWKSAIACDNNVPARAWESQGAGNTFDLEGPDAQALTMPPAPTIDSPELVTEMAEVYLMALLRDVPFAEFATNPGVQAAIARLNDTDWIKNPGDRLTDAEQARLRGPFDGQSLFRGITKGDDIGPYLSQFMLVGNPGLGNSNQSIADGFISYGSIRIDQRVRVATPRKDFMTNWEAWLDVQNGADLRGLETYVDNADNSPVYRFLATPRDLATYVHYDALYEAYLNACLIMLGRGMPFDPGIPFQRADYIDKQQGFAHFGGPHILSLVTEVATRALKAVRFQKFNVHRRARPEALSGFINRYCNGDTDDILSVKPLADGLDTGLLNEVAGHNAMMNGAEGPGGGYSNSFLLPMAFPEGSPMHPAYGAGHATVAGACVTILKAFFDHGYELPFCYQPAADGSRLDKVVINAPLTVEGELNKLASNISIGRNWAGVHYFTDYIESIRLGESIALGILEEQKLTYGENFSMTVPLFDGGVVRI
ncbi:MAG: vanadium-dependent haloperoxidase [Cyanobacteria bacterium P01_A01_bin.123]